MFAKVKFIKLNSNINNRNKCLLAFVRKPTDKIELISALEHFKIKKLFIISHVDLRIKNIPLYFKLS